MKRDDLKRACLEMSGKYFELIKDSIPYTHQTEALMPAKRKADSEWGFDTPIKGLKLPMVDKQA